MGQVRQTNLLWKGGWDLSMSCHLAMTEWEYLNKYPITAYFCSLKNTCIEALLSR